jgi:hypothetical protein
MEATSSSITSIRQPAETIKTLARDSQVFFVKNDLNKSNDLKRTNSASTKCTNNSFGYNGTNFQRKTQSELFDMCLGGGAKQEQGLR